MEISKPVYVGMGYEPASSVSLPVPAEESRAILGEEHWIPPSFNAAGIHVTPDAALCLTAVFSSINVISSDIASLSLNVFRRTGEETRRAALGHAAQRLIHVTPDGVTTAMRFRQHLMGHVLGWGNGYAEITRRGDGQPAALYLLDPAATYPELIDGVLYYRLSNGKLLPPDRVLHVAGLGWDGLKGYSPLRLARQAVAMGLAAETFSAAFFGNGSKAGGAIKVPGTLSDTAYNRLKVGWEARHQGSENAFRVAILEGGADWVPTTIDPEDAQLLATRQFQVVEIARLYRVPPHKIGDYSQSHLANIENSNIDYIQTTVMPWCVAIEAEMNLKLFTPRDQARYFVEHNIKTLLRGNMQAQADYYTKMFSIGHYSPNDIRRLENQNPIPESEGGNRRFVLAGLVPLDKAGLPAPDPKTPATLPEPQKEEEKS